ncbi:MAG: sterol desaturase family protein [Chromatiales bacterium]|nr:sterol desaturase family protein [Chromatiales bacterium]
MTDPNAPWLIWLALFGWIGGAILVALWESLAPRRPEGQHLVQRWMTNLSLFAVNEGVAFALRAAALSTGLWAGSETGVGLFRMLELPFWAQCAALLVISDFVGYWQHRIEHLWAPLWRIHAIHHTDVEIDFSTNFRHHPLEVILSTMVALVVGWVLGPALAVWIVVQAISHTVQYLNHGNVRIPDAADRGLRRLIVTPDMHRIHHSRERVETDRNFGNVFPWWDRLFGTYRTRPWEGQLDLVAGLEYFREPREITLFKLLAMPFTWPRERSLQGQRTA